MADRMTAQKGVSEVVVGVAATAIIGAGKMAAVNAAGFAVEASDAAGLIVIGRAQEAVDNSAGGNGDKSIRIGRKQAYRWLNDGTNPVTQADLFSNVYVNDSQTVDNDGGTNNIVAGKAIEIDGNGVYVETP